MKTKLTFFFCMIFLFSPLSWGQTWNLTPTMTAVLDEDGVLTISTTKAEGEAMPDYYYDSPWYAIRESINSLVIEESVKTIGEMAFYNCSNLASVAIPNSVESIGYIAFAFCYSLVDISIPYSVTTIGSGILMGCSGLTSVEIDQGNPAYLFDSEGVIYNKDKTLLHTCIGSKTGAFTIPNSVVSIGSHAFIHCPYLTSVTIPNSVKSIGVSAFGFCEGLTSMEIPNSVVSIDNSAFSHCVNLASVALPYSLETIGFSAFFRCSKLTSITIPNSVTRIDMYAFGTCTGLTDVTVEWVVPLSSTISNRSMFTDVNTSEVILHIPAGKKSLYEVDPVWGTFGTIVEDGAVVDNQRWNLTPTMTATLSSAGVLTISTTKTEGETMPNYGQPAPPWGSFSNYILSIVIEDGVTTIGDYTFSHSYSLTSVIIPNSVKSIGRVAFGGFKGSSIIIPSSVTEIGYGAFQNCPNLTDVTVEWVTPLSVPNNTFESTNVSLTTLHVPAGTKALYEAAEVWKDFGTIVEKDPVVVPEEPDPISQDGKGTIALNLSIPSNATLTGSFEIQFPEGMTLDEELTTLAVELSGNFSLSFTYKGNNTWLIEIKSKTTRSASAVEYRKIMNIAFKVGENVSKGTYEATITKLDFLLDDNTSIQEDAIPVSINVVRNATSSLENINNTFSVSVIDNVLRIESPHQELIAVYSLTGVPLYTVTKNAGLIEIPVSSLSGSVYIVKGSISGAVKVIKN